MILLMLREEGIRFGACDFDKGDVFDDARAVADLSRSLGIPCYIARSTKKGYHVYWFFSDFIPAHEFTSFIRWVYEEVGFHQRYQSNPEAGMPEVFPKQTVFENKGLGNGIKVPMIEPRMKDGWNCWVDDNGTPIPFDQQWSYFESTNLILPSDFKRVLAEKEVEILKAPASVGRREARQREGKEGEIKQKPFGSFWGVVEGCPALQRVLGKERVWSVS